MYKKQSNIHYSNNSLLVAKLFVYLLLLLLLFFFGGVLHGENKFWGDFVWTPGSAENFIEFGNYFCTMIVLVAN